MFLIDGSGMCPHNSRRYNEFRKLKGHLAIMAILEYITCNVCGEHKQVVRSINDYRSICGECELKEEQKKKQDALFKLSDGKTLEERVAALEEKMLELDRETRRNSSFRDMHTPLG
jgi:hypothetical protein